MGKVLDFIDIDEESRQNPGMGENENDR